MIISLSQQKGGVGKTVSAVFLAQFFAFIQNYRVLLVDYDSQGNATSAFTDKNGKTLRDVITEKKPISHVITETRVPNLDLIFADMSLDMLESDLIAAPDGPYKLRDTLRDYKLADKYDIIIIDTPPHLGRLTFSALLASDFVLIPLEPKIFSSDGLVNLITTIQEVQAERFNPNLAVLGAFLNKFEERTRMSRKIVEAYKEQIPDMLMETRVRYNITLEECLGERALLYTYAPRSHAAFDFTALGEEVLARVALQGRLIAQPAA